MGVNRIFVVWFGLWLNHETNHKMICWFGNRTGLHLFVSHLNPFLLLPAAFHGEWKAVV